MYTAKHDKSAQIKSKISITKTSMWSACTNVCRASVHVWVCHCFIVKENPIKCEMHNIWPLICFSHSCVTAVSRGTPLGHHLKCLFPDLYSAISFSLTFTRQKFYKMCYLMLLGCFQLTMISNTMKHIKKKFNSMYSVKSGFTTKNKNLFTFHLDM